MFNQVEKILALEDDHEKAQKEKEALVRDIVKNLPLHATNCCGAIMAMVTQ